MFAPITNDPALTLPWHSAAPLGRQPQAEHLGDAHLCRWTTTGGHIGFDGALVNIVHNDVQCDKEGFEIEFHGHVSFGERCDMVVESRRNLPLLSSAQELICIKRLARIFHKRARGGCGGSSHDGTSRRKEIFACRCPLEHLCQVCRRQVMPVSRRTTALAVIGAIPARLLWIAGTSPRAVCS